MSRKLSVEVYRDVDTPNIDPQIALDGIELVNQATNNSLEVSAVNKKIRIASPGSSAVAQKIRWGALPHDIQIVLTGKSLDSGKNRIPVGFSQRLENNIGGVAVINVGGPLSADPHLTVAHEIGHLFNLQFKGQHDERHCNRPDCIMHSSHKVESAPVKSTGLTKLLEKTRLVLPKYESVSSITNREFCQPCEDQLARRAFFLMKYKAGEHVPKDWL